MVVRKTMRGILALVILAVTGCGGTAEPDDTVTTVADDTVTTATDAGLEGSLLLYTSVPEAIATELAEVFETAHPNVDIEVFRAGTGDIAARIATERQAGAVQADLIWVAEPSAYEAYKEVGLLAPTAPPQDAPIPAVFIDPDGYYVAGRVINMVLGWNTDIVPDGLSDWEDLINTPNSVFPPPTSSGASLASVKAILDNVDPEFFVRFVEAGGRQISSNGAARDALISGEFPAAAALDYMMRGAIADGAPVDYAFPESGAILIPSPIAITAASERKDLAQVFVDFILSETGQQAVVDIGGFYPVRTDVNPPEGSPELSELVTVSPDWAELVTETPQILDMWKELFGG